LGVSQLLICTYPHAALGFARFCKTDSISAGEGARIHETRQPPSDIALYVIILSGAYHGAELSVRSLSM
ncbi:hypothetical protein, partial [Caballeronia arationis]|uniref:hypothetical protein n=1 Tax=Caballeronia arationis TaxID=1777142 RepID=UPI000A8114D4